MGRRPKILHIVVAGQIGGAERLLADLVGHDGSDADHIIALMSPKPALAELFAATGIQIHDRGRVRENPLAYLWRSYGPADFAWLRGVVEAERPDILHCHTYGSHVLAARLARATGLALVRTEHGVRHYRDPTCALNRHWALAATTKIVAVSDFVGRTVAGIAPAAANRITVIRNGIALAQFDGVPSPEGGPFTVAVAARLEPVKRLELAIAAVAAVPPVRLEIAGDGAERGKLERLADQLGVRDRVHFHGHLADPRPVLTAAHAVLNCSREEALSLALIEAGALQRPAIAFATGGIPEVVQNGKTGWLGPDKGVPALAGLLTEASLDLIEARRRGTAARAWVTAHFGIETMCEAYGAVYRSLL